MTAKIVTSPPNLTRPPFSLHTNSTMLTQAKNEKDDANLGLYSVSYRELIWRNFLVGLSRAVGGVIIQFIFVVVILSLAARYLVPAIEDFADNLITSLNPFSNLQQRSTSPLEGVFNLMR